MKEVVELLGNLLLVKNHGEALWEKQPVNSWLESGELLRTRWWKGIMFYGIMCHSLLNILPRISLVLAQLLCCFRVLPYFSILILIFAVLACVSITILLILSIFRLEPFQVLMDSRMFTDIRSGFYVYQLLHWSVYSIFCLRIWGLAWNTLAHPFQVESFVCERLGLHYLVVQKKI